MKIQKLYLEIDNTDKCKQKHFLNIKLNSISKSTLMINNFPEGIWTDKTPHIKTGIVADCELSFGMNIVVYIVVVTVGI